MNKKTAPAHKNVKTWYNVILSLAINYNKTIVDNFQDRETLLKTRGSKEPESLTWDLSLFLIVVEIIAKRAKFLQKS